MGGAAAGRLWLSAARSRRWWEVIWPKLLLGGAAAVSFMLNVAHAGAGKWSARGVAAIPPAALVLSVELLVLIVRRAAMARSARLAAAAAAASTAEATTEVVRGDQTTPTVVAATGDRPALEATTATNPRASTSRDHGRQATSDQPVTASPEGATSGDPANGATYRRVRELYVGGVTVAAEIARELGVSPSYAQRTLRRVKRDLAHQPAAPAPGGGRTATHAPERSDQVTSDPERQATRSPDQPTTPDPDRGATSRDQATTPGHGREEATRDGNGRPTSDRHLMLVAPDRHHDHQEAER